tara:strand:+ start:609 stop:761 length:153 start_codon:yes stop_codon:yes gene_type:complete
VDFFFLFIIFPSNNFLAIPSADFAYICLLFSGLFDFKSFLESSSALDLME